MRILVTGSSGFIGFHLVKRLLDEGHIVYGVDNHSDYYNISLKESRRNSLDTNRFLFFNQDINYLKIDGSFDIAINLAAQAGVRVKKNREHLYKTTNIDGFRNFCKFCKEKNIKKIIYASSSSVYSDSHTKKFIENETNLEPSSKYGKSKLKNEIDASLLADSTDISIIGLRFFSVFGPYGRPDMAYYLFTEAIKNNEKLLLNNYGKMSRDMTYIDDVINGIIGAISFLNTSSKQVKNEIFNLGNDNPISIRKLLSTLEAKLNSKSDIVHSISKNESFVTHADITKAKNLLGYVPKTNFEDGIEKFLKWHSNHENL